MADIGRFTLVQIDGAYSDHASVIPWGPAAYEQPGLATGHKILGVTATDSDYQQQVVVMRRGTLRDVARQNSETWAVGDILWAKSDGSITKTRPSAPLPLVVVGTVFGTSGVTHTVDVDVRVLPSLGELSGVSAETPADLDVFIYKASTHLWEPRALVHNTDLGVLQGGTTSEYYHLTSAEYSLIQSLDSVEANTGTKAPTAAESGETYTNEGDADGSIINLPTAAAGLTYTIVCQAAQTITINAAAGDTIRMAGSVSATAGSISTATVGNAVTLLAINATEWVATSYVGIVATNWTVT